MKINKEKLGLYVINRYGCTEEAYNDDENIEEWWYHGDWIDDKCPRDEDFFQYYDKEHVPEICRKCKTNFLQSDMTSENEVKVNKELMQDFFKNSDGCPPDSPMFCWDMSTPYCLECWLNYLTTGKRHK